MKQEDIIRICHKHESTIEIGRIVRHDIPAMAKEILELTNWISVKKSLPYPGFDVLVTDGKHVGIGECDKSRVRRENESAWSLVGTFWFEPTHWTKLPELPKK